MQKIYKHVTRNMEAQEQENSDLMKLVILDYTVPYITEIPACLVVDCADWVLQEEEKEHWTLTAYGAYDSDKRVNWPDDYDAFKEAIEKHAPKSENTISIFYLKY